MARRRRACRGPRQTPRANSDRWRRTYIVRRGSDGKRPEGERMNRRAASQRDGLVHDRSRDRASLLDLLDLGAFSQERGDCWELGCCKGARELGEAVVGNSGMESYGRSLLIFDGEFGRAGKEENQRRRKDQMGIERIPVALFPAQVGSRRLGSKQSRRLRRDPTGTPLSASTCPRPPCPTPGSEGGRSRTNNILPTRGKAGHPGSRPQLCESCRRGVGGVGSENEADLTNG